MPDEYFPRKDNARSQLRKEAPFFHNRLLGCKAGSDPVHNQDKGKHSKHFSQSPSQDRTTSAKTHRYIR